MKHTRLLAAFLTVFFLAAGTTGFAQSSARGGSLGGSSGKSSGTYSITVNSNVRGAVIYIDNARQSDTAPATFTLSGGNHSFKVTAPGYDTYERTINISGPLTVNAILNAAGHTLKVQSNVNNAQVFLNGTRHGSAPVEISVSPGRYVLKVTAPGYQDYETTVNVNRNDTITAYLQPLAYSLTVDANVRNARVTIDGRVSGSAPLRTTLPQGRYTVKVTAPGYRDYETTINVNRNDSITVQLQPLTYSLSIGSNIRNAQVTINGQFSGSAPLRTALPEGTYTVVVSAPGYIDFQAVIEVKNDTTVNATLLPALATVTIEIPSIYLDQNPLRRPPQRDTEIEVYLDGQLQRTMTFQVTPGTHTVRFASGAFVIEKEFTFETARSYTLQPYLDIIER